LNVSVSHKEEIHIFSVLWNGLYGTIWGKSGWKSRTVQSISDDDVAGASKLAIVAYDQTERLFFPKPWLNIGDKPALIFEIILGKLMIQLGNHGNRSQRYRLYELRYRIRVAKFSFIIIRFAKSRIVFFS